MTEIDLWADDDDDEITSPSPEIIQKITPTETQTIDIPTITSNVVLVKLKDDYIHLFSKQSLTANAVLSADFNSLTQFETSLNDGVFHYQIRKTAGNAFILRYILRFFKVSIEKEDAKEISEFADKMWLPTAKLSDDAKHIIVNAPGIATYKNVLKKVNAYPVAGGYKISVSRILDLEAMFDGLKTSLPKIKYDENVKALTREEIPGFDGTIGSLKNIPIGELNIVKSNVQPWNAVKASKKELDEKLSDFGITTVNDLVFNLPKRFIDKSNPQEIEDLLEGESVTIIGNITGISPIPNNMGVSFLIENSRGRKVKANFWRQAWLKTKFSMEESVLITAKVVKFRGKTELNGTSIEHSEEAAILPIVPVYKQSESKGITTQLIMSANRELFARINNLELPDYLKTNSQLEYSQVLKELHFPSSIENFQKAHTELAFHELIYMQIIMQEKKKHSALKLGLSQTGNKNNLQKTVIDGLPFELTDSQKHAVVKINKSLGDTKPSKTLLNADVGAGKTLCAQLACLKSVDAGYQAVIIGPTEILARQLYDTFLKLNNILDKAGKAIRIEYLAGTAAEVRAIKKDLKEGEVDVLVGTTAVLGKTVNYKNLGLVVIDEQQKFGAEQRSKLLAARADDKEPDILMQTATPIPRSTALAFYGDIDMVLLKEKPSGRLPIKTDWIKEDPNDFVSQITNEVWADIISEAAAGNQTFVITPMVIESDSIDAASVERTFNVLSNSTLASLKVGFVHGKLKKEEQQIVMTKFRNKEYDVLVSSTVVEVGVDIPDATRVVILSADRMGASSLHQIRGRVGRNSKPSKCYLVSLGKTENAQVRLTSLVNHLDGFEIAIEDLKLRGEGKIFASEQSGKNEMIFASLITHKDLVENAKSVASDILTSKYANIAIADAKERFESSERLF